MLLTQEQVKARLADPRNSLSPTAKEEADLRVRKFKDGNVITHSGRKGVGDTNLSYPLQNLLAVLGQTEKHREIAAAFGLSRQKVQYLAAGYRTQERGKDAELVKLIEDKRVSLSNKALELTLKAFNVVEEHKDLMDETPRDLMSIAKDAATVFDKLQPKQVLTGGNNLQIIVNTPPTKTMQDYSVIEVEAVG